MAAISAVVEQLNAQGFSDRKIAESTKVERNRVGHYRRGTARTFDWFEILSIYAFAILQGIDVGAIDKSLQSVMTNLSSPTTESVHSTEYAELDRRLRVLEEFMGPNILREFSERIMEATERALPSSTGEAKRKTGT